MLGVRRLFKDFPDFPPASFLLLSLRFTIHVLSMLEPSSSQKKCGIKCRHGDSVHV